VPSGPAASPLWTHRPPGAPEAKLGDSPPPADVDEMGLRGAVLVSLVAERQPEAAVWHHGRSESLGVVPQPHDPWRTARAHPSHSVARREPHGPAIRRQPTDAHALAPGGEMAVSRDTADASRGTAEPHRWSGPSTIEKNECVFHGTRKVAIDPSAAMRATCDLPARPVAHPVPRP
jgi:hypothetical protein